MGIDQQFESEIRNIGHCILVTWPYQCRREPAILHEACYVRVQSLPPDRANVGWETRMDRSMGVETHRAIACPIANTGDLDIRDCRHCSQENNGINRRCSSFVRQ